jgi:hypothetical protein
MPDPPYWDEYVPDASFPVTYSMSGTHIPDGGGDDSVQYPTFEFAWDNWGSADPRAAVFETHIVRTTTDGTVVDIGGPGRRCTSWDCGAERGFPEDGYFDVNLTFTSGSFASKTFLLSLYAYDFEMWSRGDEYITVYDKTMTNVLASYTIAAADLDNSIYVQFWVGAPTTIVVRIMKQPGTPLTTNAVLSGIFFDSELVDYPVGGYSSFSDKLQLISNFLFNTPTGWILLALMATGVSVATIKLIRRR